MQTVLRYNRLRTHGPISSTLVLRTLEPISYTKWLRKSLNLSDRRVLVLPSRQAGSALGDVDPDHWIVPWRDLLTGKIRVGYELCAKQKLNALC